MTVPEAVAKATEDQVCTISFEVVGLAKKFIEDYLAFIGSKETVEDFAADAFWTMIGELNDKLDDLPFYDSGGLWKRYQVVSMKSREQDKIDEEHEAQQDC